MEKAELHPRIRAGMRVAVLEQDVEDHSSLTQERN